MNKETDMRGVYSLLNAFVVVDGDRSADVFPVTTRGWTWGRDNGHSSPVTWGSTFHRTAWGAASAFLRASGK